MQTALVSFFMTQNHKKIIRKSSDDENQSLRTITTISTKLRLSTFYVII